GRVCARCVFSHGHHCFISGRCLRPSTPREISIFPCICPNVEPMTSTQPAAVVSGATSGVGRATAQRLVADGWNVVAAVRRTANLETLVKECKNLPGTLIPVTADVTDDDSVAALYDTIANQGGVDTVLNIAGGAMGTETIEAANLADWEW